MNFIVQFAPEVLDQLDAIEAYIAPAGSTRVAADYVDAIVAYCESLATFPHRGIQRDDVLDGLRITNYRHHAVIAFMVDADARIVSVVGVFYGGQDYEASLLEMAKE